MKHYIIAKWKDGCDREALTEPVRELFEETLSIPGIHAVRVKPCCVGRSNRYDIMIEIEMEQEALEAYDGCEPHRKWKENYGSMLSGKVIFDSED